MLNDIRTHLLSDRPDWSLQAEGCLQSLSSTEAAEAIQSLSTDAEPKVRTGSLYLADKCCPAIAEPLAIALLSDPVPLVRWVACEILHFRHCERCANQLLEIMIHDPSAKVRNRAAIALGGIGNSTMIPAMSQAAETELGVDHEHSPIRDAILNSISRIRARFHVDN